MPEGQPIREIEPSVPLADAVRQIFERRAIHGERKLIKDVYLEKFEQLVTTLPKEQRDTAMITMQRFVIKVGGYFSEYSARFVDYVRRITVWPMMAATKDYPRDKYYQMELARAKAWGEFALNTTKTATAERVSFRDHFLPSAIVGAESGGLMGVVAGATLAGVTKGAEFGLAGGLQGAAIGAAIGGAMGGGIALGMSISDRILGPPVAYYNLFTQGGGSISTNISTNVSKGAATVA